MCVLIFLYSDAFTSLYGEPLTQIPHHKCMWKLPLLLRYPPSSVCFDIFFQIASQVYMEIHSDAPPQVYVETISLTWIPNHKCVWRLSLLFRYHTTNVCRDCLSHSVNHHSCMWRLSHNQIPHHKYIWRLSLSVTHHKCMIGLSHIQIPLKCMSLLFPTMRYPPHVYVEIVSQLVAHHKFIWRFSLTEMPTPSV